ncbi:hypothetical protein EOM57_05380 [Candidatus Saccharibacteria bacterium]|nr:hypothetical protein [Candidatus Saccharibacteria bacterium]
MKYYLLISIVLFSFATTWSVYKVGRRNELSISLHVAQTRLTRWVFGITGSVAILLASLTIYGALLPLYDAPTIMYAAFGFLLLQMLVTVIVPYIEGSWQGKIHNLTAWGMCYTIPAIATLSLFLPLSLLARVSTITILITEILLMIIVLVSTNQRQKFFLFQSAFLTLFFALLAILTYV